jgi:hypothetical protein
MSAMGQQVDRKPHGASVPDHKGTHYIHVLKCVHQWLSPKRYLEVGTAAGGSLGLAQCAAISVDPNFTFKTADFIANKPFCALYQMTSDSFFRDHNPARIFDGAIDLAFLDGMHLCEYLLRDFANTERYCRRNSVIVMDDCVPVEFAIAGRAAATPIEAHRAYWWAGDVWRTLLALRKHRPDLAFTVVDSQETGLVFVTNLDPQSTLLMDNYDAIVREAMSLSLEEIGLEELFELISLESTSVIGTKEKMSQRFSL